MAKINKAKVLTVVAYTAESNPNYVVGYEKLVTQGSNKDFITIRVANESMAVSPKGVLVKTKRTSRLTLPADLLEEIKLGMDINALLDEWGLEPMRIIVQEQFEEFYAGQEPKRNPSSHPTAPDEEVLVDGQNIYHQTKCVPWSSDERDSRISGVKSSQEELANTEDGPTAAELRDEAIAEANAALSAAKTPVAKAAANKQLAAAKAMPV